MRLVVTKYNPENRDETGAYIKEDWTSVSDVGKVFEGRQLDYATYTSVEDQYISAIEALCQFVDPPEFYIIGLSKSDALRDNVGNRSLLYNEEMFKLYDIIRDGVCLDLNKISTVARLALREDIWCHLVMINPSVRIVFGYDYYMYFELEYYDEKLIEDINGMGLYPMYVEEK